jgi:hypothetical protein
MEAMTKEFYQKRKWRRDVLEEKLESIEEEL